MFFATPLEYRNILLKNRVFLAPLAGVSDVPFRRICQEYGAGLTYVEMLSATAICYGNRRTFDMMARHPSETVLGVQLTGPRCDQIVEAAGILEKKGFETIDINMGCPVKKVVGAGCGSAFLKDPPRVSETLEAVAAQMSVPLSCKIRLGYTRSEVNIEDISSRAAQSPAALLTIHGRTRSEGYDTPVDHPGIRRGVEAAKRTKPALIVVGNGDIFCHQSAALTKINTNCDAVMVSRGALGNPWVFAEILREETVVPTVAEWLDTVDRHLGYAQDFYGDENHTAVLMRKHFIWYSKGFPGAKQLRESFNNVTRVSDAREILKKFASTLPPDLLRSAQLKAKEAGNDPKYDMDRVADRGVGDEELTQKYISNG